VDLVHLFLFLWLAPGVCCCVALAIAMAVVLLCFMGAALAERRWRDAFYSYLWFGVFACGVVVATNALVSYREVLIPQVLQ
jgi:uncharacterized membrane protein YhaH (DUF805 family)